MPQNRSGRAQNLFNKIVIIRGGKALRARRPPKRYQQKAFTFILLGADWGKIDTFRVGEVVFFQGARIRLKRFLNCLLKVSQLSWHFNGLLQLRSEGKLLAQFKLETFAA